MVGCLDSAWDAILLSHNKECLRYRRTGPCKSEYKRGPLGTSSPKKVEPNPDFSNLRNHIGRSYAQNKTPLYNT